MESNPYSAPASSLKETEDGARPRKPRALLFLEISMVGTAILSCLLLLAISMVTRSSVGLTVDAIKAGGLLIWSLAILGTSWRRKPVVRFFGGAMRLLLIGCTVNMVAVTPPGRLGLALPVGALLLAGEIYWLYAMAFSAKAKRYLGLA